MPVETLERPTAIASAPAGTSPAAMNGHVDGRENALVLPDGNTPPIARVGPTQGTTSPVTGNGAPAVRSNPPATDGIAPTTAENTPTIVSAAPAVRNAPAVSNAPAAAANTPLNAGGAPPTGNGAPPAKAPRKRPSPLVIGIAAVVVILGVIYGIRYFRYSANHTGTDDAQVGGDVYAASAQVSGYVTEVPAVQNQLVHKGDLLARIDPREYQAAVEQAQGNLASLTAAASASGEQVSVTRVTSGASVQGAGAGVSASRANIASASSKVSTARAGIAAAAATLRSAEAGVRAAQQAIVAAQADVATARNQLSSAEAGLRAAQATERRVAQDTNRYNQLFGEGAVSRQVYENQQSQYASAVAVRQQASQAVQESIARIDQTEARVESARAAAAQADAQVQQARVGQMQAQDNVAQNQAGLDQAVAQLNQSVASLRGQQSAPGQVQVAASTATSNRAKIQQAKAQLDQARLHLGYCTIRAPADGYITSKNIEPGQLVQPGSPLMSIIPLTSQNTYVDANFKETQMQNIRQGQPAEITVDAYGGRVFKGHVRSIGSSTPAVTSLLPAENATGNFVKVVQRIPVRISIDQQADPNHLLRLGMSVVVDIDTSEH